VDELLELVGLTHVARKPAGSFSLGMGQRLGLASALLADPSIVMLDEPVNGLDPDGILWIRTLLRDLADEGKTVFLSSHLMSEMELTADHLIVIGRGRILADTSMADFITTASTDHVHVVSPFSTVLQERLAGPGVTITSTRPGELLVEGLSASHIGEVAARNALTLHALTPQTASLEEAFMQLTRDAVDYRGTTDLHHNLGKAA
jgi:ABC-2 type transport system ATP-binding protein